MAAGEFRLRIWNVTGFPADHMVVEYDYGVEDELGNTPVFKRETMFVTWAEFVDLTTVEDRTTMLSINGKLKSEIKVRVPMLADALDM